MSRYGVWAEPPAKGVFSDLPPRFQQYVNGVIAEHKSFEEAEAWAELCMQDKNGWKYSARTIIEAPLSDFGFKNAEVVKLKGLGITTIEAFVGRISDPTAMENLRCYLDISEKDMHFIVLYARACCKELKTHNKATGALVK